MKATTNENLDKLIEFIKKIPYKVEICFHGGEPLLEKEKLIKFVENAEKELGDKISFSVQTSGVGIDKSFIRFAKTHKLGIGVSIDSIIPGLRDSTVGFDALKLLKEEKYPIGVITVVNSTNQDKLFDLFLHLSRNYPVKGIIFNHVIHKNKKFMPNLALVNKEITKICDYIIDNELDFSIDPIKYICNKILGKNIMLCYDKGCGGFKRIIAYGVDGRIYACDTFTGLNSVSCTPEEFFEKQTKNRSKIVKIAKEINERLNCKNCIYDSICRKPCAGKMYVFNLNKDYLKADCEYLKTTYEYIFKKCAENPLYLEKLAGQLKQDKTELLALYYILPPNDLNIGDYIGNA